MTKAELAKKLRSAFTRDGAWNFEALITYGREFWRGWIEARLRHRDPWVPYGRDEYPDTAAWIFVRYAREAQSRGISIQPCQEGAGDFLSSLDWQPTTDEPAHLLRNALFLIGKLRARTPEALATLRELITSEVLLGHAGLPLELHRTALYALAAAQQRGNDEDRQIWLKWLEPWDGAGDGHRHEFIPAAFSGLAISEPHVPKDELLKVLALYQQARAEDHRMKLTPAILALWIDREGESVLVREELWEAVCDGPQRDAYWEIIRMCADRAWPCISPGEDMERLYPPGSTRRPPVPEPWAANVEFSPAPARP